VERLPAQQCPREWSPGAAPRARCRRPGRAGPAAASGARRGRRRHGRLLRVVDAALLRRPGDAVAAVGQRLGVAGRDGRARRVAGGGRRARSTLASARAHCGGRPARDPGVDGPRGDRRRRRGRRGARRGPRLARHVPGDLGGDRRLRSRARHLGVVHRPVHRQERDAQLVGPVDEHPRRPRGAGRRGGVRGAQPVRAPRRHRRPVLRQPVGLGRRARQRRPARHDVQPGGLQHPVRRRCPHRLARVAPRRARAPDRPEGGHRDVPPRHPRRDRARRVGAVAARAAVGTAAAAAGAARRGRVPPALRRLHARQLLAPADVAGQGRGGRRPHAAGVGVADRGGRARPHAGGATARPRAPAGRWRRVLRAHPDRGGVGAGDDGGRAARRGAGRLPGAGARRSARPRRAAVERDRGGAVLDRRRGRAARGAAVAGVVRAGPRRDRPDGRAGAARAVPGAGGGPARGCRCARRVDGAGVGGRLRPRRAAAAQRGHRLRTDPVADAVRRPGAGPRRAARVVRRRGPTPARGARDRGRARRRSRGGRPAGLVLHRSRRPRHRDRAAGVEARPPVAARRPPARGARAAAGDGPAAADAHEGAVDVHDRGLRGRPARLVRAEHRGAARRPAGPAAAVRRGRRATAVPAAGPGRGGPAAARRDAGLHRPVAVPRRRGPAPRGRRVRRTHHRRVADLPHPARL
ncbi:MAG: hypothetical protein AVDCRST_MAG36-3061, partial [uncultured Nocardioidaceae bacterium]